jgi:hypothetical protein
VATVPPTLRDRPRVGVARLEAGDELGILVVQRPHDADVVLTPRDDPPIALLGPLDDDLDRIVERSALKPEAGERLVDHDLVDPLPGAATAAVDAEQNRRLVL